MNHTLAWEGAHCVWIWTFVTKIQVCQSAIQQSMQQHGSNNASHSSSLLRYLPHFVSTSGVWWRLHNIEPTIFDFVHTSMTVSAAIANASRKQQRQQSLLFDTQHVQYDSGTFIVGCDVDRTWPLPKWTQRKDILAGAMGGRSMPIMSAKCLCSNAASGWGWLIRG